MKKFSGLTLLASLLMISSVIAVPLTVVDIAIPSEAVIGGTINLTVEVTNNEPYPAPILVTLLVDIDGYGTEQTLSSASVTGLPGDVSVIALDAVVPAAMLLGDTDFTVRIAFGDFVVDQLVSIPVHGTHDIDASGGMPNIADLTYMVGFMFNDGNLPLPDMSNADFNCDRQVDISDLTQYVGYMFEGSNLPCISTTTN